MSSLWEQRAARNEALFREVNENIARLEERHGATESEPVYVCECANAGCTEQLAIDPATYRRVREQPRLFFVRPGHEDAQLERIVERHRDYLIVEKTGEAGEVAEQTQS
jgi:formate-nitrite transporter family protein